MVDAFALSETLTRHGQEHLLEHARTLDAAAKEAFFARLAVIARPDHAVITNARAAHVEHLGTREEIVKAMVSITR